MAAPRSLDVGHPQVLVYYDDDDDGFHWHHRLLLAKAGQAGVWVTATPDHELQIHDLLAQRHIVLNRNAPFPDRCGDEVYAFDPITRADLDSLVRQAKLQARILAGEEVDDVQMMVWLVSHPRDMVGDELPQDVVDDENRFTQLGGKGIAELRGEIVFVERVAASERDKWRKDRSHGDGDDRLLGLHYRGGRRFLPLREALSLSREQQYEDWTFEGPRLAKEYLDAIDEAGGFTAYQNEWMRKSGVVAGSAAAHEHRTGIETLRLLIEIDQVDPCNLQGVENLCRRQAQIELAVERCPTRPDYSGLDEIMGGPTSETGAASTRKFRTWLGNRQKDRANVLKQTRLEKEEREALSKKQGGGSGSRPGKKDGK